MWVNVRQVVLFAGSNAAPRLYMRFHYRVQTSFDLHFLFLDRVALKPQFVQFLIESQFADLCWVFDKVAAQVQFDQLL